jgi:MFS family permease
MATYGAGYMATAMVCGVGCDHLRSRRMILVLGGVLLCGSTALVCTGTTLPALVLGRLLQGSAAAVTWVIGQALLLETMGEEAAGRAMGYVTAAYSLSMLVAPLLGGLVYPEAGSTAVYGMAFGLMAVDIALRTLFVEEGEKLRWPEGGGSAVPLPSQRPPGLTLVTDRGRRSSWHRLGLLLCSPRVWATILGLVVVCATLTAFDTTVPIFVKERFGWNSRDAGLVFLALLLPLVVGGPGVGEEFPVPCAFISAAADR